MVVAPLPLNEPERLANLKKYKILDSINEQVWDDLALLASQICQTPIAAISFMDAERQWFKSILGLDTKETPRDVAFCAHAILQAEALQVPDAEADPRFSDNALVTGEPFIRFYAGSPITSEEGFQLGTVCVLDRQPRELSPEQLKALDALARQAGELLTSRIRNQILEEAKASLSSQLLLKNKFLSHINHQLRTPLNTIIGYATLLEEDVHTQSATQSAKDLGLILDAAQSLEEMVQGLLDLSDLERSQLAVEEQVIVLNNCLNELQQVLQPLIEKTGSSLQFETTQAPPQFLGDKLKLHRILLSLLNNALKFGAGQPVVLRVYTQSGSDGDKLRFEVEDQGCGMAPEVQECIFDSFYQAVQEQTEPFSGMGVGLSIAQQLANRLGGRLSLLRSMPDQGSCFALYLPLKCP